jgi:hypothetical protein
MNYIDFTKLAPEEPAAFKKWREDNYKKVTVSPNFALSGILDDEPLRRFVNLPKLFDLLNNKRLVLPTLEDLIKGDPFECFAKKNFDHLNRVELELRAKQLEDYAPESSHRPLYPPNLSAADFLTFRSYESCFGSEIKEMTDEELRNAVWYMERERLKNHLVCSCWHKGTIESDAMWKIYASQLGVSISSSASRMKLGIKMIVPKIYSEQADLNLAAVHYEDTDECRDIEPWLIKRKGFVHEQEVRLYCDVPFWFRPKFQLEVDLSTFIEEIVITPFIESWQVAGIKGAIEALLKEVGAEKIPVRQSKHMRVPQLVWPPATKTRSKDELKNLVAPIIGETQS